MVQNMFGLAPQKPKVLLLGVSFPSVAEQMEKHGYPEDVLHHKETSVDQVVECVKRGILTEMDARDLARCIGTEKVCDVDAYTVSREIGAVYRDDRHIHSDFNARNFCNKLKGAFDKSFVVDLSLPKGLNKSAIFLVSSKPSAETLKNSSGFSTSSTVIPDKAASLSREGKIFLIVFIVREDLSL